MVYGNKGGDGQPQSLSAVFSRYAMFGQTLQPAVSAPRGLLGKTWGQETTTLKFEDRFDPAVMQALRDAGHDVEILGESTAVLKFFPGRAGRRAGDAQGAGRAVSGHRFLPHWRHQPGVGAAVFWPCPMCGSAAGRG